MKVLHTTLLCSAVCSALSLTPAFAMQNHMVASEGVSVSRVATKTEIDAMKKALKLEQAKQMLITAGHTQSAFDEIITNAEKSLKDNSKAFNFAQHILQSALKNDSSKAIANIFLKHFQDNLDFFKKPLKIRFKKASGNPFPGTTVEIPVTMDNGTLSLASSSKVSITTSSAVVAQKAEAIFGEIQPASSVIDTKTLSYQIPKAATCGEKYNVIFDATAEVEGKKVKESRIFNSLYIGKRKNGIKKSIHNKLNNGTVELDFQDSRKLESDGTAGITLFKDALINDLKVEISYFDTSGLGENKFKIILVSPSNEEFVLSNGKTPLPKVTDRLMKVTFPNQVSSIDDLNKLDGQKFEGDWKLKVESQDKTMTGRISAKLYTIGKLLCPAQPIFTSDKTHNMAVNGIFYFTNIDSNDAYHGKLSYQVKRIDNEPVKVDLSINEKGVVRIDADTTEKPTTAKMKITATNEYGFTSSMNVDINLKVISSGTDTPGTDTPGTDTPGTDTPGTDTPGTDTPGTDTPGTDTPGTDTSGTDTPSTDNTETPKPKAKKDDGGGALFHMIAGLFILIGLRRRKF